MCEASGGVVVDLGRGAGRQGGREGMGVLSEDAGMERTCVMQVEIIEISMLISGNQYWDGNVVRAISSSFVL